MPGVRQISYERQPPIGNTLIDDDSTGVFIRIFPDRTLGRGVSWLFVFCGIVVIIFALAQMTPTGVGVLQSIPIFFAASLFFLLAVVMRYTPRGRFTTIQATTTGIEYAANGFAPRFVERAKIQRVFTRNAPLSKRMSLGIRFVDGGEMLLGAGNAKEIESMARSLHRVLNAEKQEEGAA